MEEVPEQYVLLVQVLAEDAALQAWFASLAPLARNQRYSELGRIATKFERDGRTDLARLITSLNEETIYRAIARSVRELQE